MFQKQTQRHEVPIMVLCSQYRLTDVLESEGNSEQPQGVGLESVGRGLGFRV